MEVESTIESVVVYARGARVRRTATVSAPVPATVRLVGLPLAVIDDTLRSELEGPGVVRAVRVGEDVVADVDAEESAELRTARRRVTLAEAAADRLGRALDRLAEAAVVAEDPSEDAPAPWASVVAARRRLIALRGEREVQLRAQLGTARRELDAAQRAYDVAAETDARTGTARAAKLHEPRKYVELELELDARGGGALTIHVEYLITAARWAPSYVARIGDPVGGGAGRDRGRAALEREPLRFELRAVVAQDSGEDWDGVALRLSTAEPTRFAELPELAAQKIGRRQHEPAKRGFRPAPTGADELYRDYDRAFPRRIVETSFTGGSKGAFDDSTYEGRAPTAPEPVLDGVAKDQVWDEESSNALPALPPPALQLATAPMPKRLAASARAAGIAGAIGAAAQSFGRHRAAPGRGGAAPHDEDKQRAAVGAVPRLDYASLVMAPPSTRERGRLVDYTDTALPFGSARWAGGERGRVAAGVEVIEGLELPPGHANAWDHVYDFAFASDGAVDVKADGGWHSVALLARDGTAKLRHVAVPREQADVFRVASIANPLDGPLLPGPIDIYDRGQFLVTSEVDYTPPGGTLEVGLGVDAQVKIARNADYHEETTGVLRGGLRLVHAIAIDAENLGPRAIELEIRERVPVVDDDDDDVEVVVGKIEPAWERWTPDPSAPRAERLRGGQRWLLHLAAGAKQVVRASYEIKIAGKHELVGGNRREP